MSSSVEVIKAPTGAEIRLIPPRGVLEKLRHRVRLLASGKVCVDPPLDLRLPSTRFTFEVDVVVDDGCPACPTAVELLAELASMYGNVVVAVYNASHTEPPFSPALLPAFRINRAVEYEGLPHDMDSVARVFEELFLEAYVETHPRAEWLRKRVEEFAKYHGYALCPSRRMYMRVVAALLRSIDEYGHPYCPCRPLKKPAEATPEQIYALNRDRECPCIYSHMEIRSAGRCRCGLLWSRAKAKEYLRRRAREYGWALKQLDRVARELEELRTRVLTGGVRVALDRVVNRLMALYAVRD